MEVQHNYAALMQHVSCQILFTGAIKVAPLYTQKGPFHRHYIMHKVMMNRGSVVDYYEYYADVFPFTCPDEVLSLRY